MTVPGFDPLNPPQLPREQCQVAGCDCGAGPRLHVLDCSLLRMPRADEEAAVEAAEAKVRAHGEWLNAQLAAWQQQFQPEPAPWRPAPGRITVTYTRRGDDG